MTTPLAPTENRFLLLSIVPYEDKKEKASSKPPQPKQKATVRSIASDPAPSKKMPTKAVRSEAILERIRKCLDRGRHPTTPEAEARSAVAKASKLMKDHNLTEAETFAESGTMQDESPLAGESVVSVTHTEGKKALNFAFTWPLECAMNNFFDCKSYHTARANSYDHVFYGISKNTAAAAMAFEMCYNLILNWALSKTGVSAKHSYCLGVANGLGELAEQEKKAWIANNGLQLIVADGNKVAEDYLQAQNRKLRKGRKMTSAKDMAAYKDGQKDSKKIDVRGKRLQ